MNNLTNRSARSLIAIILAVYIALACSVSTFGYVRGLKADISILVEERTELLSQIEELNSQTKALNARLDILQEQTITPEPEPEVTYEKEQYEPQHNFHDIYDCVLTAYCSCYECCGVWSPEYTGEESHTYTGTVPKSGRTVSVDPDVIPLGAIVVIDGHEYIAEDTGNFSGNVIDIYFDNHEDAWNFGRRIQQVSWYLEGE